MTGRELSHTKGAGNLALGSSPPLPRSFQSDRPAAAAASTPSHSCILPFPALPCSITSYCSLQTPSILLAGESRAYPVPQFPLLCSEDRQDARGMS